jgi:cyanate lyase
MQEKKKVLTYVIKRLMSLPPSDPTLYRLVEIIQVFGYPLKAIIHEKV